MSTKEQSLVKAIEAAKRVEDHPNLEERLQLQIDAIVKYLAVSVKPAKK